MNNFLPNIVRFFTFLFLQAFVFKGVDIVWGSFDYIHIIILPLVIYLIPLNMPRSLVVLEAFLLGLGVDMFYDSPGVHAAALTAVGFLRQYVLRILQPHEGYQTNISPSAHNMGFSWFLSYSSILGIIYFFLYFSVERFSYVYIFDIVMSTVFSFIFSMIFILFHQVIFKTKV